MWVGSNLTGRQDQANVVGSNATVYGNHCTVTGSNANVYGHNNVVTGSNANVVGNNNKVTGSSAHAKGDNNTVSGTNATAKGSGNVVRKGSSTTHRGLVIQGGSVMNFFNDDGCTIVHQVSGDERGVIVNDTPKKKKKTKKEKKKKKEKFVEGPPPTDTEQDKETEQDVEVCVVCMSNRRNCITGPCRHLCVCVTCARTLCFGADGNGLAKRGDVKCPMCRKDVKSILRVHE
jgi:hypothetical protein